MAANSDPHRHLPILGKLPNKACDGLQVQQLTVVLTGIGTYSTSFPNNSSMDSKYSS